MSFLLIFFIFVIFKHIRILKNGVHRLFLGGCKAQKDEKRKEIIKFKDFLLNFFIIFAFLGDLPKLNIFWIFIIGVHAQGVSREL